MKLVESTGIIWREPNLGGIIMWAQDLDRLRVDTVGSFLRPSFLKDAFAAEASGSIDAAELNAVKDRAVRELIGEQELRGLPIVNDGEFRRRQFMESFADIGGMEPWRAGILQALSTRIAANPNPTPGNHQVVANETRRPVAGRLKLLRNALLDEYAFAAGVATAPVKVTLIGPDRLSQRYAYEESRHVYPGVDAFLADVVSIQRQMIGQLHDAGCRYVQIDAPSYTSYIDGQTLAAMRERGEDPGVYLERSIAADNAVIADFPGMTFGVHLCRGNNRSQWHRQGGYDAIAERLFNSLDHRRLLLEYDDERSGGFEPLRFVPKGKVVVLGLITTKSGRMETVDELRRRVEAAAAYLPLEQLALSPQCGFASSLPGNLLSEDDQWRKIEVLVQTAEAIWG
jgi:5-methyltetrahydropteroyltriglutamate--homocysteine methyltransferase